MKHVIVIATVLVASVSPIVQAGEPTCPPVSSDDYYFPPGTFEANDGFLRGWYSTHLRAMDEPTLWCSSPVGTLYRFTWLRTRHHPVTVRVTNIGNDTQLDAVELDGAGGYVPGVVKWRVSRTLSKEEWLRLHHAMEAWGQKTPPFMPGFDGSEWVFERRTSDGYSATRIWTPRSETIRALGKLFLATAGISVPSREDY